MINDVFKSFFRTIGRILAYLFLGVVVGVLFTSCDVHAETLGKPTSINVIFGLDNSTTTFPVTEYAWYGLTNYGIKNDSKGLVSGYENGWQFWYQQGYCKGKEMTVNFKISAYYEKADGFFTNQANSFRIYNGVTTNACTISNINTGGRQATLTCPTIGTDIMGLLVGTGVSVTEMYGLAIQSSSSYVCEVSNSDIVGSNNQNAQNIINNQNSNTDKVINNNNSNTDKVISSQDKITQAVKDSNETNKSILQKIIDLPSTIINLLINALKSLFIPEDDYFTNKFNEIRDNATAKLGILGYPFILVTDTLEFFLTIEDTESYVIKWSGISVPNFEDHNIIEPGSFDFATLLENNYIKIAHDLYMVFINALLILSFLKLCSNKYASVFAGSYDNSSYLGVDD